MGRKESFIKNDANKTSHFRGGMFWRVLYHYHTFIVATSVQNHHLYVWSSAKFCASVTQKTFIRCHESLILLRFKLNLLTLDEGAHSKSHDALHTYANLTSQWRAAITTRGAQSGVIHSDCKGAVSSRSCRLDSISTFQPRSILGSGTPLDCACNSISL